MTAAQPKNASAERRDEAILTAAARRGDMEALASLWQRHRGWIAAVLLAHKPGFEDLEDLLQEVATTLVAKIGTVRDDASLRAWLRAVAVNAARASGRSGKYRQHASLEVDPPMPSSNGNVAHVDLDTLERRLRRLPSAYREPLLLRATKGMSSKQIGDLVGAPPATVDTRIARGRRMLRELESEDEGSSDW